MKRNTKLLTLALTGVVLISAMAVPLAQGDKPAKFTTDKTQVTTDSENINGAEAIGFPGRTLTCESVTGVGVISGPVNGEGHIETEEFELSPTFSGCSVKSAGFPGTIAMNGCTLGYKATKDNSGAFTALMDVKCPAGHKIEANIYQSATKHSEGKALCTYTMGEAENQDLKGIELTNKAGPPKDLVADFDVKNLHDEVDGSKLLCGSSSGEVSFLAKETWRATDKNDKYVDLLVSG